MTQPHPNTSLAAGAAHDKPIADPPASDLGELLARAATLAVEQGGDLDDFMKAAWSAFVDARPGLREHIEALRLIAELDALRQNGRIPMA